MIIDYLGDLSKIVSNIRTVAVCYLHFMASTTCLLEIKFIGESQYFVYFPWKGEYRIEDT